MNAFKIRNLTTGEYFSKGYSRGGKINIKWAKLGQIWHTLSGPRQVYKLWKLKGIAEIVEFELKEIR